jgi:hypothetical protein
VIRGAALGLTLVLTIALAGCGLLVTDEAPADVIQVSAPSLIVTFPEVDALVPTPARALSLDRARRLARQAALQVRIPGCSGTATGRGFALDSRTIVAHRGVLPKAGWMRVWAANGRSTAVGAASAYRIGDLAVARVARPLPRRLPSALSIDAGASVVVVTERGGKLRMLPGVVVDSVPGAPYGAPTKVLRLTAAVRDGDAGPVLDVNGRVIAALFAVDPRTTLGLALASATLRGRAAALEALPACDD